MSQRKAPLLFSSKADILNRNAGDWLTAHISFMLPIHKYKGDIELTENKMVLMYDGDEGISSELVIERETIKDVFLGFDEIFHTGLDRSRGLSFQPLRITFLQGDQEDILYLIIDFNRLTRGSRNKEWFNRIGKWMKQ